MLVHCVPRLPMSIRLRQTPYVKNDIKIQREPLGIWVRFLTGEEHRHIRQKTLKEPWEREKGEELSPYSFLFPSHFYFFTNHW